MKQIKIENKLNELWNYNVYDVKLLFDNVKIIIHHGIENQGVMICMGYRETDWRNLKKNPFDGIFRGRVL